MEMRTPAPRHQGAATEAAQPRRDRPIRIQFLARPARFPNPRNAKNFLYLGLRLPAGYQAAGAAVPVWGRRRGGEYRAESFPRKGGGVDAIQLIQARPPHPLKRVASKLGVASAKTSSHSTSLGCSAR